MEAGMCYRPLFLALLLGLAYCGEWQTWQDWRCEQKFVRSRTRECPAGEGKCNGESTEKIPLLDCPGRRAGGWGLWGGWTACSETCGDGRRLRVRSCDTPTPRNGGRLCEGEHYQYEDCKLVECPVDGQWEAWSKWGPCSVSCGGGAQVKTRIYHPAQHNGTDLQGEPQTSRICNPMQCPVWESWLAWTPCSGEPGGAGRRYRNRLCHQPGKLECRGEKTESIECITPLPVDGGWSSWEPWNCRRVLKVRYRTCTNPVPEHRGEPCKGQNFEVRNKTDFQMGDNC